MRVVFSITAIFLAFICATAAAGIYKYQDENGKWHFSDKAPDPKKSPDVETVHYKQAKKQAKPSVVIKSNGDTFEVVVDNPFHAPVEVVIRSTMFKSGARRQVIAANAETVLLSKVKKTAEYKLYWVIGDPKAEHDQQQYQFPVSSRKLFRITQSFNGKFSHTRRPNKYAVDIGMPIGTYIAAARGGVVLRVKDDFHMGAAKKYFLDKANVIQVLHEDGTYATYAHILLGSALVKPGDKVAAGDRLARSGTSGYSTGPHLHFVVQKNTGFKTVSQSFYYVDKMKKVFSPQAGMHVEGF